MLCLIVTKLHFTVYHPHYDGQTEVRNLELEQYLRAFTIDRPNKWVNFCRGLSWHLFVSTMRVWVVRQYSVAKPLSTTLAQRFFGPCKVIERIGTVAYGGRVHDVFHMSLLRPFVEVDRFQSMALPLIFARGRPVSRLVRLLDTRTIWCDANGIDEGLLQ